jgi:hypothetical protein
MASPSLLPALLFVSALLSSSALAGDRPPLNWIADAKTGCRVANPDPGPDDSVNWSGGCKDGRAAGRGVLQWFKDGTPLARYEGEVRDGEYNGRGTYIFANYSHYEGEFRAGRPNGIGTYTTYDEEVLRGIWTNGCFSQGGQHAGVLSSKTECGSK